MNVHGVLFISVFLLILTAGYAGSADYKPIDIPGADRPDVEHFRAEYSKPFGCKKLAATLDGSLRYRLYVRKLLVEKKMPASLEYLPVIESDYNPAARSKDGKGVGLWQFMPNSTEPFLTRNEWIDERLDPWKSTVAALTKLQDNYRTFNDWLLAIAAYNCGAGAMTRILAQVPEKNFWYLSEHNLLPDHTIRYVPKFLAIADLAQNSAYYGIELPTDDAEAQLLPHVGEFDYVTVCSVISLARLAGELRMDEKKLFRLNPALLKGVTPPDAPYMIRLPAGMKVAAEQALTGIKTYRMLTQHVIVRGDTLWSLSRTYETTVSILCTVNGISPETVLQTGKYLYIPRKITDN